MTTREAMFHLKKSEKYVEELGAKGIILPGWAVGTSVDWLEDDVIRAKILMDYGVIKDWLPARKMSVLYCRSEPNIAGLEFAKIRVAAQKERMMTWILGRGMDVDLTIAEVRPVMRYRELGVAANDEHNPSGFQALLGLLSSRKVKTLYIESHDRFGVGSSWYLVEDLCKLGRCEIVTMNTVWPTDEMRAESKSWMADILLWYKVMNGEIDNQAILDTYLKGHDVKSTMKLVAKIDAKLTQVVKAKRLKRRKWEQIPLKQRVIDLDDCFDVTDIYKSRTRIGLVEQGSTSDKSGLGSVKSDPVQIVKDVDSVSTTVNGLSIFD